MSTGITTKLTAQELMNGGIFQSQAHQNHKLVCLVRHLKKKKKLIFITK